tara:strand:+ start:1061 stop:1630 length:570 start_codon:yes stop_codon:yes gene_type:complete
MESYKQIAPELWSISQVLTPYDFYSLHQEFLYDSWKFQKYQDDRPLSYPRRGQLHKPMSELGTLGDNLQLIKIGTKVQLFAQKILKTRLELSRIHTNIQFFGQESTFHIDVENDTTRGNYWGFLIFAQERWDTEWGGDFVYNIEEGYYNVPYIPNNGVIFNTQREHRGMAPNLLCNLPRFSVQFMFREI